MEMNLNLILLKRLFPVNNNQLKGVKVHQIISTSGFTIETGMYIKNYQKFMYDVNVVEHEDSWFKITE